MSESDELDRPTTGPLNAQTISEQETRRLDGFHHSYAITFCGSIVFAEVEKPPFNQSNMYMIVIDLSQGASQNFKQQQFILPNTESKDGVIIHDHLYHVSREGDGYVVNDMDESAHLTPAVGYEAIGIPPGYVIRIDGENVSYHPSVEALPTALLEPGKTSEIQYTPLTKLPVGADRLLGAFYPDDVIVRFGEPGKEEEIVRLVRAGSNTYSVIPPWRTRRVRGGVVAQLTPEDEALIIHDVVREPGTQEGNRTALKVLPGGLVVIQELSDIPISVEVTMRKP
jgi:hypothetical protein